MDDQLRSLRDGCERALAGHGPPRATDLLATVPPGTQVDRYGDGGVVAELETEVAGLLGLPAAVYLPSGIMAQQALLRTTPEAFAAAVRELAREGLWTWERAMTTGDPAVQRVELPVGDATLALTTDEIRDAVARLGCRA